MSANVTYAPGIVDVRKLFQQMDVEDFCRTAEEHFAAVDREVILAKPFTEFANAQEIFVCLGHLIAGLRLKPGMTVLDFGAGSCWLSHALTQFGCRSIALDVSATALATGRELYARRPIFGQQPEPQFLHFDGRRIDLPDNSVDRIVSFAAFHHVPNPETVIAEMGRVLRPDGIAGFVEPGPNHSKSVASQTEMRNHRVLENDVDVDAIWAVAKKAGFDRILFPLFCAEPLYVDRAGFDRFLADDPDLGREFAVYTRDLLSNRRVFLLVMPQAPVASVRLEGLKGELTVRTSKARFATGEDVAAEAVVRNTGSDSWLIGGHDRGVVNLGSHLYDKSGNLVDIDHSRHALSFPEARRLAPGESVTLAFSFPAPRPGRYRVDFDLVCEGYAWFAGLGGKVASVTIDVI